MDIQALETFRCQPDITVIHSNWIAELSSSEGCPHFFEVRETKKSGRRSNT